MEVGFQVKPRFTLTVVMVHGEAPHTIPDLGYGEMIAERGKWMRAGYQVQTERIKTRNIRKRSQYDIVIPHRTLRPLQKDGGWWTKREAEDRLKWWQEKAFPDAFLIKR